MEAEFKIDLANDVRGLLWTLWQIFKTGQSGILSIRGSASGRAALRKEIAFVKGEAIGVRSNWPQDSLRYFMSHQKLASEKLLAELWAELPPQVKNEEFIQQALSRQIIQASEIQQILGAYFQDRLFNQLTLRRGSLEWKSLPELSEKNLEPEIVKLAKAFDQTLIEEIRKRFDESYCRSRFSKYSGQSFRIKADFPLPLGPQELRAWNQMRSKELQLEGLSAVELCLVTAAFEFELLEWSGSLHEKLEKELLDLQKRFQGATPFQILDVSEEASESEAKAKYLKYVKCYHPDRLPSDMPETLRGLSELILSQVNEAFSIISDPEKKKEWLAERELQSQGGREAVEKKIKAELAFEEARMALKRRHFSRASDLLDSIMGFMGEDLEYQVERAYATLMKNLEGKNVQASNFASFHKVFDQSIQMRPDYANAFYYKGLLLKLENQLDQALSYFDQAVFLDEKLQEAASEARLIRMRKEKDKSKSWFRKKT